MCLESSLLENASLYEDYCTCTCFVLIHIKCVDMSIFLLGGVLNDAGVANREIAAGMNEQQGTDDEDFLSIVRMIQLKSYQPRTEDAVRATVCCHSLFRSHQET